jgi:hypothetical protein
MLLALYVAGGYEWCCANEGAAAGRRWTGDMKMGRLVFSKFLRAWADAHMQPLRVALANNAL